MVYETCLFWQKHQSINNTGLCRFSSPLYQKDEFGVWPTTAKSDWCADFKCSADLEKKLREEAKKDAAEFGKIIGEKIREAIDDPIPEEEKN